MSPGQVSNYGDKVEPIAIVGMAARFPGDASSVETFWDMIVQGRTGHSKVPSDRFDAEAWYHPNHERRGAIQPRSGFFIDEDPATFDAPFFSITAKEAAGMDPMQRKLLEVAYEAFENAGIPMESLPRSQTGVYTGVMTYDYELMTAGDPMHLPQNPASGTSRAMLSNRISWFFDLRGPSFSLDTACSSSLYALHLACQSLRLGETTQALVTGTNMILAPNFISQLSSMHMLSPDGISHSFDARANGYARGEAVAGIVVKTLRKALEDGDTIRAVIRGTGANQDGKTPGITMPSGEAQAALIRSTYEAAGLDMQDTCYFEAHGTGTSLGDPIELGAIGASFGADRSPDRPLIVGSVKTNVGHTEGTAGLAGVIKAVLALERGIIPPVAGFERLNPKLRLEEWKLKLPLEPTPWPTSGLRRASVNSFGFGGANAHVILDDARHYLKSRGLAGNHRTIVEDGESSDSALSVSDKSSDDGLVETKLFVFSAFDREGVQRLGASYANFLGQKEQAATIFPDDLAYTLAARRTQFDFRSFAVASSLEALRERMQALPKLNRAGRNNNPIFVFTGQGAQWPAMGCELLANTVFRQSIERSQSTLDKLGAGWRVADLLCDPTDKRIDLPTFSQPVCTILQLALVDLLRSWGVRPRATVGHSSGEVAAAYGAELIRHEDAVKIGFWRGFYSEEVKRRVGEGRGAMMAAGVSEDEAQKFLGRLPPGSMAVVACVNSPSSVTLSGDVEAIDQLETMLQQEGRFARKLRVQVAYHSPHMRTVADDFVAAVGEVATQQSDIVMFSSVTEERIDDPTVLGAHYWMRNLISAVRFSGALTNMLDHAPQSSGRPSRRRTRVPWSALVEVGPHEALKGPCRQILAAWDAQAPERIPYASILTRGKHAGETAKAAAGLLWAVGHPVDLLRVNKDDEQHRNLAVLPSLPPYPWNHSKGFWHEPPASVSARLRTVPRTDLLGVPVPNQNPMEPCWRNFLRASECPWQEDHVITGTVLYPAAGMLIMAIEAAKQLAVPARALHGIEFRDVRFDKGLVIPAGDQGIETFLSVRPHPVLPDVFHYTVFSTSAADKWTRHSWGSFAILYDDGVDKAASTAEWQQQTKTLEAIKSQAVKKINVDAFYDQLQAIGTEYGPTFRNVVEAAATPEKHQGWGTIAIPDTKSTMPHEYETPHLIHPATLDAIFHLIFVAMGQGEPLTESAIPTSIESMFVSASQPSGVGSKFLGFASASSLSARDTRGDMVVSDVSWTSHKIVVKGMVVTEVSSGASGTNQALPATAPKRAARLTWKEDVDTLSSAQASAVLTSKAQNLPDDLSKAGTLLVTWLDLACFKHADLEVLLLDGPGWEDSIGLLKRFAPVKDQRFRFARCAVVTKDQDAASGFENSLADAQLNVTFATPDKTEELGQFDLVLAPLSNNIPLSQATSLLRPGGKIALSSTSGGKSTLDKEISEAGLRELISIDDHDGTMLVIVETDAVMEPDVETTEVTLLHRERRSPTATAFEDHLSKELSALGIRVTAADLSRVEELTGKAVISLLEIEEPFVIGWDEHQFEQFRKLTAARYLLWITHGGILEAGETSLSFAPTTGLLRTVRIEKPQICLPHLDLSPATELTSERAVELTIATLRSSTRALVKGKKNEMELAESGGVLYIPRAEADDGVDKDMELSSGNVRSVPGPLYSRSSTGRKLEARRAGQIDTVRWVEDGDAKRPLEAGEVEIKVSYVALNEPDIRAFTSGAAVPVFGREVVGTVAKIGAGVTRFRPGDRVFALHQAELSTHVRKSEEHVRPVPPSLPSEAAAALPLSLGAAWHILTDRARLQQGESLLIDGATGSLGLALVQVAKFLQARIYASVDSDTAKDVLVTRHGMSAESIFDSRSSSLSSSVLLQTGGKGVDVVISASTGAALRSFSSCVGDDGRFVDVSQRADPAAFDPRFFKRSVSFSSVYVGSLGDDKLYSLTETVLARMGDQAIPKTRVYSVSALANAAADAQSGQFQERTVLELSKDAVVPLLPSPPPRLELDPEGTYVLAGGLGVLGLIIAEHMVAHGARHLLFLSRSGASTRKQQDTLESFRSRGCVADAIKCDVTDASQVAQVARTIRENQWKLKGVVQLAMVLRDSIFENMTYDKWRTAIDPKVKGTWNLHSLLLAPQEDTVDFFIILSSMSGIIGNTAQANYAAGNTYEDAVALHRHRALGLAATTLNVGLVTDVDHFNEDSTVEDYLKKYSHWIPAQLTHRELLVAIEAVMRGATADGRPVEDQLLVGINDEVPRDGLNLWPQDRKFDHRISTSAAASGAGGAKDASLALKLRAVQTLGEAAALAEEALRINVANALTASPGDIDVEKPLYSLGVDSLKAIEVRNWIFNELKADVSVFDVLSPVPLSRLAVRIISKSALVPAEVAKQAAEEASEE